MKIVKTFAGLAATGVALLALSGAAQATAITCGTTQRTATLADADECKIYGPVTGTPSAADIGAAYSGTWTSAGSLAGSSGTNGLFTVNASSWGQHVTGTWSIADAFWDTYGEAVISMHVGNGGGNPDWFLWSIPHGATSGTFSYDVLSGSGGGLSNLFLWGSGTPTEVPEPMTLGLLGLALAGLGLRFRGRRS